MYYFMFVYLLVISVFEIKNTQVSKLKTKRKVIYTLPIIFLFFFKYGQGADYVVYEHFYYNPEISNNMEALYNIIAKVSYEIGISFPIFYSMITSCLFIALIFLLAGRTKYFLFSFFYFFGRYLVYFHTTLRQGISLVLFLFVFFEIYDNDVNASKIKIIVFSLFSFSFHKSSLPFILLLALYYMTVKSKKISSCSNDIFNFVLDLKWAYVVVLSFVIYITISRFIPYFLLIINSEFINHRLQFYLKPTSISSYSYRILEFIAINLMIENKEVEIEFIFLKTKILSVVSLLLYSFLGFSSLISTRMLIYVDIFKVFLIPKVIVSKMDQFKFKNITKILKVKLSFLLIILLLLIPFDYLKFLKTEINYGNYYYEYYPYVSLFNKNKILEYSDYFKILNE